MTGPQYQKPESGPTGTTRSRLPELDVLRFLAVAIVILHHWDKHPDKSSVLYLPLHLFFGFFWRLGWNGVDLFFVLSGFLVSGLLYREYIRKGRIKVSRFLIRRGLKIYPAFYLFILLSILVNALIEPSFVGRVQGKQLFGELLFLQNYVGRMWGHTWSLAVEEHFYLMLGLYIYLLASRNRKVRKDPFRGIVPLFLIVAISCLLLRVATYAFIKPVDSMTHWFPTHLRIDSLLFGVLLSYLYNMHYDKMSRWVYKRRRILLFLSAALVLACLPAGSGWFPCTIGFTLTYLGFGCLLLVSVFRLVRVPHLFKPPLKAAALIGSYSYSIYLWHIPTLWVAKHIPSFYPSLCFYLAGCLVIGCTMAKLIEMPVLKLRDRIFPSECGSLVPMSVDLKPAAAPEPMKAELVG